MKVTGIREGVEAQLVVAVVALVVVLDLVDVLRVVEVEDVLLVVLEEPPPLPEPTMAISAQVR